VPFNLRKHLTIPLGLLIACSVATIVVVQIQFHRVDSGMVAFVEGTEPGKQAVLEMEVNTLRVAAAGLTGPADGEQGNQRFDRAITDFREWAQVHARHAGSQTARSLGAEIARDFEQLGRVAALLAQRENAYAEKTAALRTTLAELDGCLTNTSVRPGDAAEGLAVAQMSHAVDEVGLSALLRGSTDPAPTIDSPEAGTEAFASALVAYRKRSLLPRERAWATDLERRFTDLVALSRELATCALERRASWEELVRDQRDLDKKITGRLKLLAEGEAGVVTRNVKSTLARAPWLLIGLACATVSCALATVLLATRSIARPMGHLVEVARAITNGRTRHRASPEAAGDFRMLADAFNQMIEARQHAEDRLQLAHDSLELKVQARTIELWRANKALREETEQRAHAEREFQQAQKMDALGKLAGSIAHDFNNLLTVIIGGAECAQNQLSPNHPAVSLLRTVQQAGERAAGLTRPLLTFSRNQVLAIEQFSLNEAVEEASQMLHRLLGVNIQVRLQLDPELRLVKANATQLQQVLVNLAVNARDAMDGIGVLTITTANAVVDPTVARRNGLTAAEYWVEVAVSDTGCGIDAATKARIFEPFFTTKPAGRGTGLGLSTVFGIVKQSGGLLNVESKLGEGTTFRVLLPATTDAGAALVPVVAPPPIKFEPSTGKETLLVVDDEEDIRELAALTLQGHGYRVFSAGNSEEAILLGEKHAAEIRLLITDVVMPGINGVQLAGVLTKIVPDLKVLFVSGHSNESISEETLLATNADYLQKPYLGATLVSKVREILAGGRTQVAVGRLEPYSAWVN
jgi:signal transduction histidine kinase/ActR/RegA family two-component response regulator